MIQTDLPSKASYANTIASRGVGEHRVNASGAARSVNVAETEAITPNAVPGDAAPRTRQISKSRTRDARRGRFGSGAAPFDVRHEGVESAGASLQDVRDVVMAQFHALAEQGIRASA